MIIRMIHYFRACVLIVSVATSCSALLTNQPAFAWQSAQTQTIGQPNKPSDDSKLSEEQRRLAEQYRQFEDKMFSLYEHERQNNPIRSQLLQRAFQKSQENRTTAELQRITGLLDQANLKDAEISQEKVLKQLNALLDLLQSEDRGKRIRDDILRHQDYLKEVERLQRLERSLRGQAENDSDPKKMATDQESVAKRTSDLENKIRKNDEGTAGPPKSPDPDPPATPPSTPHAPNGDQPGTAPDDKPQPTGNPVEQKLQTAEKRMREALQQLNDAKKQESVDAMRQAEQELAEAKRQLEEILRQLREEEMGRSLALLETRFRQMLEREIKVHNQSQKLDQIALADRLADFQIQAAKLSIEQKGIAAEAARALLLLDEDGSSTAMPQAIEMMHADMLQVAERLTAANINAITIELEAEIVETLKYMVDSLARVQRDLESEKGKPPSSGQSRPGERPLVNQLAELKMVRSLQDRIYRRHVRYAALLGSHDDPVGRAERPDLREALEKLADRQRELVEITRAVELQSKKK